jgi:hypothetical protein
LSGQANLSWRSFSECLLLLASKEPSGKVFINFFLAERFWKNLAQEWGLLLVLSLWSLILAAAAKTWKLYLSIIK